MRKIIIVFILTALVLPLAAQESQPAPAFQPLTETTSGISFRVLPSFGSYGGSVYYLGSYYPFSGSEGALWLSAAYKLPFFPLMYVGADIGGATATGIVLGAKAGAEYGWKVFNVLELSGFAQLGAWYLPISSSADEAPNSSTHAGLTRTTESSSLSWRLTKTAKGERSARAR